MPQAPTLLRPSLLKEIILAPWRTKHCNRPPLSKLGNTPRRPTAKRRFRAELAALLENLSGIDVANAPSGTSFLELGFDSLFLTQASQAIKTRFNVAVSFRQMMGDLATLDAVADHLNLTAENFAVEAAPIARSQGVDSPALPLLAASPATGLPSISGPGQGIEQVMAAQLASMTDLINRQLRNLAAAWWRRTFGRDGCHRDGAGPATSTGTSSRETASSRKAACRKKTRRGFRPIQALFAFRRRGSRRRTTPFPCRFDRALHKPHTRFQGNDPSLAGRARRSPGRRRISSGMEGNRLSDRHRPLRGLEALGRRWQCLYSILSNGFGPTAFGHAPDFVRDALIAQIHQGFELGPQTPLAGEVAKLFCDLTGNERMTFCNTGSEAVMAAMRIARTVTGRNRIVYFAGDYHGQFDEVLARRGGSQRRCTGVSDRSRYSGRIHRQHHHIGLWDKEKFCLARTAHP